MKILVLITTILTLGLADTGEGLSELISLDTVDPAVQVLAPNGGENLARGYTKAITWTTIGSDFSSGTYLKISLYPQIAYPYFFVT